MRVELKIDGHKLTCEISKKDVDKVGLKRFTDKAIELLSSDNDDYVEKLASDLICQQLRYNHKLSCAIESIKIDTIIEKLVNERISCELDNIMIEADKSIRYYTSDKLYDIIDTQLNKAVYTKVYNQIVRRVFDKVSNIESEIKSEPISGGLYNV